MSYNQILSRCVLYMYETQKLRIRITSHDLILISTKRPFSLILFCADRNGKKGCDYICHQCLFLLSCRLVFRSKYYVHRCVRMLSFLTNFHCCIRMIQRSRMDFYPCVHCVYVAHNFTTELPETTNIMVRTAII